MMHSPAPFTSHQQMHHGHNFSTGNPMPHPPGPLYGPASSQSINHNHNHHHQQPISPPQSQHPHQQHPHQQHPHPQHPHSHHHHHQQQQQQQQQHHQQQHLHQHQHQIQHQQHHMPHQSMNYGPPPPQPQPPPPPPPPHQTSTQPMQGAAPMPSLGQPAHPPQPPPPGYLPPSHPMHLMSQERGSPFYQHIPQTEFKIIELNKRLQSRPQIRGPSSPLPFYGSSDESNWWERFVCEFFDDDSTLTLRIPGEDRPIEYKICRTLIPRFFRSYFEGGVTDLQIKLRNSRETTHNPSLITLDCEQADIITKHIFKQLATNIYRNVVVHTEGHLSLDFVSNNFDQLLIKSWRFYANQCHEYIDRSMTSTGLPSNYLVEPVTRFGLTKSTSAYLRMCMVMEPMQDLMAHHIQTKLDPKSCLKHILFDRYKVKNIEPQPNKRRRRKTPAAAAASLRSSPFSKKAKVNGANALNNNVGMHNNLMPSNDISGGLPLASQDVLVVGEPSMLGADFGDENERRITRLENNQYDSSIDLNAPNPIVNNGSQMNQHSIRMNNNSTPHQHPNQRNENSGPNEINHQVNYSLNGEMNHIVKTEMDMQSKQAMGTMQVAEPELSRE